MAHTPPRALLIVLALAAFVACARRYQDTVTCTKRLVDPAASIAACTRLIERPWPGDRMRHGWYAFRGAHRMRKGELQDALADFDAALRLRPDDPALRAMRADALRRRDDADRGAARTRQPGAAR